MVNILPRPKSIGDLFAEKIGGGIERGVEQGLSTAYKLSGEKSKRLSQERSKIGKGVRDYLKDYDPGEVYSQPSLRRKLEDEVERLVDEGYSVRDAAKIAHESFSTKEDNNLSSPSKEKGEGLFSKSKFSPDNQFSIPGKHEAALVARPLSMLLDAPSDLVEAMKIGAGLKQGKGIALQKYLDKDKPKKGSSFTEMFDKWSEEAGVPKNRAERLAQDVLMAGTPGLVAGGLREGSEALDLPEEVTTALELAALLGTHKAGKSIRKRLPKDNIPIPKKSSITPKEAVREFSNKSSMKEGTHNISERVKKTEKSFFNPKEGEARRKEFSEKVKESPIQEYLDIDERASSKERAKRPETIAKEAEITRSLTPVAKQLSQEISSLKKEIADLRKGKGSNSIGVKTSIFNKEHQLVDLQSKLEDINYQLKNFRRRPTEAQTDLQIKDSISRMKSEAFNPTPEGEAKIQKDLDADRKYLDHAEKLRKRGELPSEFSPDTYIKMNTKYLNAYKEALKAHKEISSPLVYGDGGDRFAKMLKDRISNLEAKIEFQTDKIKTMRALEKPSGAFYKQQLKTTRQDLERFNKDFFTHVKRMKSLEDAKTSSVSKRFIEEAKSAHKDAKEAFSSSGEGIPKLSEQTKVPETKLSDFLDGVKKDAPVPGSVITPKVESKAEKHLKRLSHIAKMGSILGIGQALVEEWTGYKIPISYAGIILGRGNVGKVGTAAAGNLISKFMRNMFEDAEAERLNSVKDDPDKYWQIQKDIKSKRGTASYNRIINKKRDLE